MLASRLLKATRYSYAARPARREPLSLGYLSVALARGAAVAICLCTLNAPAFGEEKDAAPSAPKAEAAKRSRKPAVREKTQSPAPAPAGRPTSPSTGAAESGSAAQARPRPANEEKASRAPLTPLPPPDTSAPPPRLPSASREKMRACAIEWSKLKLEARNPMPLWRDFGAQCLTR